MFLLDSGVTYLNHGAFGACPEPVLRDEVYWVQVGTEQGGSAYVTTIKLRSAGPASRARI